MNCRICGSAQGEDHVVREMMFGSRDEFRYFHCRDCGCLQIVEPPDDPAEYYPPGRYYSFHEAPETVVPRNPIRRWIKRRRDAALLFDRRGLFARLAARRPNPGIADLARWLAPTAVRSFNSPILDVGCGSGAFLMRMAALGFTDLTGVDPYLPADQQHAGVTLLSMPIDAMIGRTFDLVTLHHALEHMPDQVAVLNVVRRLLTPRGVCLIRVPIASQGPWRMYGADWAEIDAPRHCFLHTERSLQIAARNAGLGIDHIQYESEPFSYAASELYRRGVPLYDAQREQLRDWNDDFTAEEVRSFHRMAAGHNLPGWAGRAAFFLTRNSDGELSVSFTGTAQDT